MPDVLLVEDDPSLQAALTRALSSQGFVVTACGTAMDALGSVTEREPDLVILDLGLPDLDGGTVLRLLRSTTDAPVLIATSRREEGSIVALLNAGADDYVTKPFSSEQLLARVSAILRRTKSGDETNDLLAVGGLSISRQERVASLDGHPLELNRLEFELLSYLASRPAKVVTRQELVRAVWRRQLNGTDRTIDVHVSWLRRKLGESAAHPRYLHTIRGVGWKLTTPRGDDASER
jgi:DNA-binding response OmpR family regulator